MKLEKTQQKPFPVSDRADLDRFEDKEYRVAYMEAQVRAGIAYQFQALRKKFGFSQGEMAERIGKPQSVVSRLENTEYGRVTVQTLLDVAVGLDVALLVQFVSYPDFLDRTRDKSEAAMQPNTFSESREAYTRLLDMRQIENGQIAFARKERLRQTILRDAQYPQDPQASTAIRLGLPPASAQSASSQPTLTASAMAESNRKAA